MSSGSRRFRGKISTGGMSCMIEDVELSNLCSSKRSDGQNYSFENCQQYEIYKSQRETFSFEYFSFVCDLLHLDT